MTRTVLVLVVVIFTTALSVHAQETSGQADWTAGISDAGRFGGPNSVGDTIADDREARDPAFRLPTLNMQSSSPLAEKMSGARYSKKQNRMCMAKLKT